jgi:hypothetical protein
LNSRRPRPLGALMLAGLLVIALGPPTAEGAVRQSVDFTAKYQRSAKGKSRGALTLRTVLNVSDDTGAKPPALTNTTLRFPKGAVVNARYFKRCSRTALAQSGPKACPASSKIGTGRARGDARPIVANVDAKVTLFNGEPVGGNPTILIYAVPDLSSPLTIQGILRTQPRGPYGYVLDVDIPPIPTLPGQPNASVVFFDATTLDRTVRRRGRTIHYIDGPVLCTGTFFMLDGSFSYEGGITNTVLERFTLSGGPRCPPA